MPIITAADAPQMARRSHRRESARRALSRAFAVSQAFDIQCAIHDGAIEVQRDLKQSKAKDERARLLSALASAAKGWQSMQDQIRILRGKPLPGSLRPEAKPKKTKRTSPDLTFKESLSQPEPCPLPDPIDPCI